jgi:hypothetical protein
MLVSIGYILIVQIHAFSVVYVIYSELGLFDQYIHRLFKLSMVLRLK